MKAYKEISKLNKSTLNGVGLLNDKMSKDMTELENLENKVQSNYKMLKSVGSESIIHSEEQIQNKDKLVNKSVEEQSKSAVVNANNSPIMDTKSDTNNLNQSYEKMIQKEITKENTIKSTIKNLLFGNEQQLKSDNLNNRENNKVINSLNLSPENVNKSYVQNEKESDKLSSTQNFKPKELSATHNDNKNDKTSTAQNKKIDINIINNNTIGSNLDIDDIVTEITKKLSESVKNLSEGISE